MRVQAQRVVCDLKALGACDVVLTAFDFGIEELFHPTTVQTNQMVVVLTLVELIHGFAAFKLAARQQTRLFELHQHPVNGGQANVGAFVQHQPIDVLRAHVALRTFLEQLQDGQPGHGCFQAGVFQIPNGLHVRTHRYNGFIIACSTFHMNHLRPLLAIGWTWAVMGMLVGCSTIDDPVAKAMRNITPYRSEVVQGNFVSKEQVQALRVGMTRQQVKDILGTPLIASLFHADRWDYAFTIRRQGTAPQQRKLSVFFQNDVFERVDAQDLPSEAEFAERIAVPEDRKKVPRLQATPEELDKFRKSEPQVKPAEPVTAAPAESRKSFPPLEPTAR